MSNTKDDNAAGVGSGDLLGDLIFLEKDKNRDARQTVVRLRRSYWHDRQGVYMRTELRYLRTHTFGFNVMEDDCVMIGADDVLPRVVNLDECECGIYEVIVCNETRDWETNTIDDWDYKLVPFTPNTPVTDAEPSTPANTRAQSPRSV